MGKEVVKCVRYVVRVGIGATLYVLYIFRTIVCCRRVGQVVSILSYLLRRGKGIINSTAVYLVKCKVICSESSRALGEGSRAFKSCRGSRHG
jgi:hypothetical protein